MGLMEHSTKKIIQLYEQVEKGRYNAEQVVLEMGLLNLLDKKEKSYINILALKAKFGKRIVTDAIKINLLGDGEAIDIGADSETEKIKCPEKDYALITRAECLDYSGSHNGECSGCDHKVITQNLLLGPPESKV